MYKIVVGNKDNLEQRVNDYLEKGYQLHGHAFCMYDFHNREMIFYQTLVGCTVDQLKRAFQNFISKRGTE